MPDPRNVRCPGCRSQLKLKQAVRARKKLTCPKCSRQFVVNPGPQTPDEDDFLDDDDVQIKPRRVKKKAARPAARGSARLGRIEPKLKKKAAEPPVSQDVIVAQGVLIIRKLMSIVLLVFLPVVLQIGTVGFLLATRFRPLFSADVIVTWVLAYGVIVALGCFAILKAR
jgi:hypothetical protein